MGGAEFALVAVGLHKPPDEQQQFCRVDVLSRMQITFDHERLVIPTFDLSPIRSSTNSAISPAGRRCLARGLMYCSKKSVSAPLRGVPKLQLSRLLRLVAIPIVVGRTLPFQEGVHSPVRDML